MVLVATVAALVLLLGGWWRWRRPGLPPEAYEEYMRSPAWRRRKRRWYASHVFWRRWCRVCWSRQTDLHHRFYGFLGKEHGRDLVPLCRHHHAALHTIQHRNGWSVKHASDVYLSRPRVRLLTAAPALPVVLAAAVVLPHLR